MYLLIPGRHHLLTQFQVDYLQQIISNTREIMDVKGNPVVLKDAIDAIIFPITSANHSNTRRNPLPFYLRVMAIEAMAQELDVPVYIYGIDDIGNVSNFADYTLKRIKHESDGMFNCTQQNTLVICSTHVLQLYEQYGYTILPAELQDINTWQHHTAMPWDIVEHIAKTNNWQHDETVQTQMHKASYNVWNKYHLGEKVQLLFKDAMISSDGDLTETRDYNVYVRQMDDIAELKYHDTSAYIQQGRIGDIGCAVGSWMKLAASDERLRESDLYGIEVSRHLFELCRQRKGNGDFNNPFVFFSQKNAVTGLVFDANSMNTIHTSSLTHEIESYGSRTDLLQFIQNRYDELVPSGVWINRDVVGPANKKQMVYLWVNKDDGNNENPFEVFRERQLLSDYLEQLSTYSRFIRFAKDFRHDEGYTIRFTEEKIDGKLYIYLSLQDACEFISRKDYTDNWQSEMHETFCYWDFDEWKAEMKKVGFAIHNASTAFTNDWIAEHRWKGKIELFTKNADVLEKLDNPVTTMILIGVKQL